MKRRKVWLKTSCDECHCEVFYLPEWDNIPNLCKSCKDSKWHIKDCLNCSSIIRYHEDWKVIFDLCDTCRKKQISNRKDEEICIDEFIYEFESRNSYYLMRDINYYRDLLKINHFLAGSKGTHVWSGEFEGKSPQFIINKAADLAESVGLGILEFVDVDNDNYIKYDVNSQLLVIFKCDELVTTYMVNEGVRYLYWKVLGISSKWIKSN